MGLRGRVVRSAKGRIQSTFTIDTRNRIQSFVADCAANKTPISINIVRKKFSIGLTDAKTILAEVAKQRELIRERNGVSRQVVAKFANKRMDIKKYLAQCAAHKTPVSVRDLKKQFGGGWNNLKAILDEATVELDAKGITLIRKDTGSWAK